MVQISSIEVLRSELQKLHFEDYISVDEEEKGNFDV